MGALLESAKAKLLHIVHSVYLYLLKKAGKALASAEAPAEADQSGQLPQLGLAVIAVLLVLILCSFCCCCCGRGGSHAAATTTTTMKAPGRRGARISRSKFESNPGDYFKNLRTKKE